MIKPGTYVIDKNDRVLYVLGTREYPSLTYITRGVRNDTEKEARKKPDDLRPTDSIKVYTTYMPDETFDTEVLWLVLEFKHRNKHHSIRACNSSRITVYPSPTITNLDDIFTYKWMFTEFVRQFWRLSETSAKIRHHEVNQI